MTTFDVRALRAVVPGYVNAIQQELQPSLPTQYAYTSRKVTEEVEVEMTI